MTPLSDLHARIAEKKVLFGCAIESLAPATVELAGELGFDIVWADLEHFGASPERVEMFCIAARAGGAWPLVRVPWVERPYVMHALESGARLITAPMVESPDTARRLVEFGKYAPLGNRGFAMSTRGLKFGTGSALANVEWANRETHLFPQIETVKGLENCRDIVSVDGVSGALIGPADLSFSMGKPLRFDDPDLAAAVARAVGTVRSVDKIAMIATRHPALLKAALSAGVQVIICATERASIRSDWQNILKDMSATCRGSA